MKSSASFGNGLVRLRASTPQIIAAKLFTPKNKPINATMTALGLRASMGRTTTRSMAAEMTKPRTIAAPIARTVGKPDSISVDAKNAENIPISPWAKFSCPVDRKMTTSASASRAMIDPSAIPLNMRSTNSDIRSPPPGTLP